MGNSWMPEGHENKINRMVTPAQGRFLDMIEDLKFCHVEQLEILNGDPVKWQRVVEQKRFDIDNKGRKS